MAGGRCPVTTAALSRVNCPHRTKLPVGHRSTKNDCLSRELRLLTYPASIPLCTRTLSHLSEMLRAHRRAIGCRWRRLDAGRQALLVLAHLRNGDTYARLAAGFGVGIATVYRYIREAVDLLAVHAPDLQ